MSSNVKPMKAATCEDKHLDSLRFPLFASLKLDGIRSLVKDHKPLSSALKPIRNNHVFDQLSLVPEFEGLDGELLLKDEQSPDIPGTHDFNLVSSAIMGAPGQPEFVYWVFDNWSDPKPFCVRYQSLQERYKAFPDEYKDFVKMLPQVCCETIDDLKQFESEALAAGYEGVMIRTFDGKYKYGEGTLREQVLLKRKPFVDAECVIVGFVEEQQNTNEATVDNLGRTKRSSHKDGLVGKNTLGKFLGVSPEWGDLTLGKGKTTHVKAKHIWDNQEDYLYRIAVYKYQEMGIKDKPRLPIFKGFRHPDDLDPAKLEALLKCCPQAYAKVD